jgi:agmatine deiminase
MPAEWEPHEATWLTWPHHRGDWPGKFAAIPWVYTEIVRHLHTSETVHLLVEDRAAHARVSQLLKLAGVDLARIRFFPIATDRVWTRDYAPIFVVSARGQVGITHWQFNAWAKYDNWRRDAKVPLAINRRLKLPLWQPKHEGGRIVLEGGSIDVNGQGLLLTTEECLLSDVQARNTSVSVRPCGWAAASPATTRTGTSTTWPASSPRARLRPSSKTTPTTPTIGRCARTSSVSRQ